MIYYPWVQVGGVFMCICASGDNKPSGTDGCVCFEYDTGKRFFWSGGWQEAGSSSVEIQSGVVNLGAGGSATVTFNTPFSSTPKVVCTSQFNSADTSTTLSCHTVSTTGFTLRGAGNAAGNVAWIAHA